MVGTDMASSQKITKGFVVLFARLPHNGRPSHSRRSPMQRFLTSFSLILVIAFSATPAVALPAPMSKDELLSKSDLVALVRVLSVTCTAVVKDERTGEDLPSYSAKVELMEVIKGDEAKGDTVNITFHALPTGLLGPWSVYYYPGEMVWTHLVRDGDAFTTIWWNGRGDIVNKAVITELPTTPGETVEVPRRSGQSRN